MDKNNVQVARSPRSLIANRFQYHLVMHFLTPINSLRGDDPGAALVQVMLRALQLTW
jgi:hypothetical protein